jgi:hypothetical protein
MHLYLPVRESGLKSHLDIHSLDPPHNVVSGRKPGRKRILLFGEHCIYQGAPQFYILVGVCVGGGVSMNVKEN